jgi:hypothetical protein
MPIKSIEKQLDDQGVLGNFPRMGKLHKGAEKTDKGTVGRDQDYFRLSLEPQYEEVIRPAFVQLFGEKPMQFNNVLVAADSADLGFRYFYEEWAHARLLRRCDGEDIVVQFHEAEQRYSNEPVNCTCNPLNRSCHERGTMDIVIPSLFDLTGMWGKFTVLTGSVYDIIALRSSMRIAGVFHAQMENLSFWSIPFRVGRAVRSVPVTINGKRSIKPMSLLYADIEPEFNQKVFMPMVTAPTQMLLNGVNPITGEMPEISIEQAASWDRDYVNAQTIHLFDHENHQMNAIDKMISVGDLEDYMTDETVIELIVEARKQRETEKAGKNVPKPPVEGSNSNVADDPAQSDLDWVHDVKRVAKFIAKASKNLKLDHGGVINALRWADDYTVEQVSDFHGTPQTAWAACVVLYCDYDTEQLRDYITDPDSPVRIEAERLINTKDIPF